ncbi:MAG: DMT family transporter [Rhodoferax sp.]|jgi:drug/metabolite transporter (DMT)-like permease|uniref:DMT family transporter n=1 Tax=Rhodoferax sp. TaxID=50421 RepID=UPI001B715647|nr:DMT family transporter [Rhodoferax sp.]MBP9737575.1 DMT family transporter [Rhodoferax sp.]
MKHLSPEVQKGLWLGLLGVGIFALTLPLTRLAVGTPQAPQLSGLFVSTGRATLAALLSIVFLWATRAPWPTRANLPALGVVMLGVVFGFPMFSSIAMRHVEAVHASVMLGVLPLATAGVGAWLHRQRPSGGFWLCAALGSALVIGFAMLRSGAGNLSLSWADTLLLAAMACAAVGYGVGSLLSQRMRAEHVICWALILGLPLNLPLALMEYPQVAINFGSWLGFFYVAVFSQWLGFFAWYRGLALGGTVRVSQVQLLQPFLSMLFAVPILGERLDLLTVGFGLAVIAVVFVGQKMPVHAIEPTPSPPPATLKVNSP